MQKINDLTPEDLPDFFMETAIRMGIPSPTIIEKDFWLIQTLRGLFNTSISNHPLVFKGGTSLSKCFGLIQRFSEDIDLTLSRQSLGFDESLEDIASYGSKKRAHYFDALAEAANAEISQLKERLSSYFGKQLNHSNTWSIEIDTQDPQQLLFNYPLLLKPSLYPDNAYVKPKIRLEFGCRGDQNPHMTSSIVTYIESTFSDIFTAEPISVDVLDPARTFWEKATLLHMLAHQKADKTLQPRMARHYYDLYCLTQSPIGARALDNIDLLLTVAQHKSIFFRSKQAAYDEAKPGSLRLIPDHHLLSRVKQDYLAMEEMFFGDIIPFEKILSELQRLEHKINTAIQPG
ncbi:MAG: hypothetical protein DHS20C10_06790 [marine bacterium B5-7]|nr:MAG: hypothetical protein DHS20C10_06790 [marine bacterium B5-7]